MANPTQRDQVFFSYSRKDKKWLELFQATLKPLIRAGQISVWDDTEIKAGDIWRDKIEQALASAKVAVLLVSTNFLNSNFIAENELPPLLEAAQNEGLGILLVVIGPSLFEGTELGRYQAVNDASKPLESMTAATRNKEIVRICGEIKAAIALTRERNPTSQDKSEAFSTSEPTTISSDSNEPKNPSSPSLDILASANKKKLEPHKEIDSFTEGSRRGASNASDTRWKHFVVPLFLGIALGMICAVIVYFVLQILHHKYGNPSALLTSQYLQSEKEKNTVIVIGSGTVTLYLQGLESYLFDTLRKDKDIDVQLLRGPTLTGAKVFAYTYDQVPILAMASEKLSIGQLQRYTNAEQNKKMPQAVFEAYLGADPLQIVLIAEKNDKNAKQHKGFILDQAFREFKGETITLDAIAKNLVKRDKQAYKIYVGSSDSGTRKEWEKHLTAVDKKALPPESELVIWESSADQAAMQTGTPKLFLGSVIQNKRSIDGLPTEKFVYKTLQVVNEKGEPVTRGLYLYGLIGTNSEDHHGKKGYDLQKPIAITLKYIFDLLNKAPNLTEDAEKESALHERCRKQQIDYFHLEPLEGWISDDNNAEEGIYRIQLCEGRTR